jgi:hypothetical protein
MSEVDCLYQIQVPVHTYVRKFIQARYECLSWTPSKSDRIGKFLVALLERVPNRMEKYKAMPDSIHIKVLNDYALRKGFYLTQNSIEEFNEYIRLEIVEEVMRYQFNLKNRIGIKKYEQVWIRKQPEASAKIVVMDDLVVDQLFEKKEIIYDFLSQYNITEDDFSYESIKKATYRLKLPMLSA